MGLVYMYIFILFVNKTIYIYIHITADSTVSKFLGLVSAVRDAGKEQGSPI